MAERLTGIDVREDASDAQSIARAATGITAFVGRTLRGPLNRPVVLHGLADFRRTFGGLWQPSTLSYAVEQYFESGGTDAIVVRRVGGQRAEKRFAQAVSEEHVAGFPGVSGFDLRAGPELEPADQ